MLALTLLSTLVQAMEWRNVGPGGGGWIMTVAVSPHHPDHVWLGGDIQGALLSTDGGGVWQFRNQGFRDYWINSFAFHPTDPNVIWAGGKSGVYKSTDGGGTWGWKREGFPDTSENTYSMPISALVLHPEQPEVLYAGTGEPREREGFLGTLMKSTDGGETWFKVNQQGLSDSALITALAIDSRRNLLYLGTNEGVFISSDGGATFASRSRDLPHPDINHLVVAPSQSRRLYATLSTPRFPPYRGGVYRSDNQGRSWYPINVGLDLVIDPASHNPNKRSNWTRLVVDPRDADTLYVGSVDWVSRPVFRSDDGAESWTPICGLTQHGPPAGPLVDPDWIDFNGLKANTLGLSPGRPDELWFADSMRVFRSDAGEQCTQTFTEAVGTGWRTRGVETTVVHQVAVHPARPQRWFVGYGDIGLLRSDDGGQSYHRVMDGVRPRSRSGSALRLALHPSNPDHLWASFGDLQPSNGTLGQSRDGGKTWKMKNNGLANAPIVALEWLDPTVDHLAVVQRGHGVFSSTDLGDSWLPANSGILDPMKVTDLAVHPTQPQALWAVRETSGTQPSAVYWSSDGAQSWNQVNNDTLEAGRATTLVVAPSDARVLYLGARERGKWKGGVFKSEDAGESWIQVLDERFVSSILVDPHDPQRLLVGLLDHPYHDDSRGGGVRMSMDGGATWEDIGEALPVQRIDSLSWHPDGRVLLGSHGAGLWVGRPE